MHRGAQQVCADDVPAASPFYHSVDPETVTENPVMATAILFPSSVLASAASPHNLLGSTRWRSCVINNEQGERLLAARGD